MNIKIGESTIAVNWAYDRSKRNCKTTCYIQTIEGETKTTIASGTVRKFHEDQFEYEKARKVSLKSALKDESSSVKFSREERAAIWHAYHNRKPAKQLAATTA